MGGFHCDSQIHDLFNNEVLEEKAISALLPFTITTQLLLKMQAEVFGYNNVSSLFL